MGLKVQNISKLYKDNLALDDVSFSVEKGEILALLGANGAGKSTALKCLMGLMDPNSGIVLVDDKKMSCDTRVDLISNIAYLNCEMGMYARLSLKENYYYYGKLRGMKPQQIEEQIEKLDKVLSISPIINKKFNELSSGQKQKSLLALSVIHDPDYLIFDEITSSLDVLTCNLIYEFLLEKKKEGKGIIFATHIMHEVEILSDRISILEAGKVVSETDIGTIKSEIGSQNLFKAFCEVLEKHKKAA